MFFFGGFSNELRSNYICAYRHLEHGSEKNITYILGKQERIPIFNISFKIIFFFVLQAPGMTFNFKKKKLDTVKSAHPKDCSSLWILPCSCTNGKRMSSTATADFYLILLCLTVVCISWKYRYMNTW